MLSVFRIMWMLLHFLLSAVNVLERWLIYVRRKLESISNSESAECEVGLISRRVKSFEKVPSHLVVIVGNENLSFRDLANITVWCIAAGISFISFYDHSGVLKRNEAEFYKALSEVRKGHVENIIWGRKTLTNGLLKKNGTKNGICTSKKICVNIFSLTDGKGSIVELTKNLCQSVLSGHLKSSDVTQELLEEKLQTEIDIPEPELGVYCGDACSTYGFLPWQIRVTEFLNLPTHHNVTAKDFLSILHRFGQCEQRFGK